MPTWLYVGVVLSPSSTEELQPALLHALSDPSRLRILSTLLGGERCVHEIVSETGLSQPNVSKHLACLLGCGLVEREPRGRHVFYEAVAGVDEVMESLDRLLDRIGGDVAGCRLRDRAA